MNAPVWNIIVTTESGRPRFLAALGGLRRLGAFWTVPFKGVCVGQVRDVAAFLEVLRAAKERGEIWALATARAIPVERTFRFTPQTLAEELTEAVTPLASRLAPGRFYFRLERRGLAGEVPRDVIEREIADHVFSLAAAKGVELHTSFTDADTVLAAETVGDECGVALLPRVEGALSIRRHPLMRLAARNKKARLPLGDRAFSLYGLAVTYFRVRNAHYHRRKPVSRSCSGWEGVVPGCCGRQIGCGSDAYAAQCRVGADRDSE